MIKYLGYLTLFFAILLVGCKNVKNSLVNKIEGTCNFQSDCTISLKDLTKFKWDKVYFFRDWTTSVSIAETIGFNYHGDYVPDDNTRILFSSGNKIVYEEDIDGLDYYNSTNDLSDVVDTLEKTKSHYLSPSEAIFKIEKSKREHGCKNCFYYILSLYQ